ncbi:MAG: UvrD-helicase domain-containing protein, partial [Lentisphaerae bacterium]|nr:UvrD-helicase domain-containing protein [Lentisphaerota bacterium]
NPLLDPLPDVDAAADRMESLLDEQGIEGRPRKRWNTFIEAVRTFSPGTPWTREVGYLFEKLVELLPDLRSGEASLRTDRDTVTLVGDLCPAALDLVRHVASTEILRSLQQTRGIHALLARYETFYDEMMRRQGRLTFQDAQYLLTDSNHRSGGAALSRRNDDAAKLYIDYRLDCELDHWLLDEFQDTSDIQWQVLSNLVDEILQDETGSRSFFYVGDVKQAIYGWRGGNPRLFNRILREYPDRIKRESLATSFRSCPEIIDTVNTVFGAIESMGLPDETVRDWKEVWQEHRFTDHPLVPAEGHVALLEPRCDGGGLVPGAEDRYSVAAALLRDIDPVARGLSTALLVRTNKEGEALVDFLRRNCPGLTIVHEGSAPISDNPVVTTLLALVKIAEHPGDMFSWRLLQMGPLAKQLDRRGLSRANLPRALLTSLHGKGYRRFLLEWSRALDASVPLDEFGHRRLRELLDAADEFDQSGGGSACDFLRLVDGYSVNEPSSDRAVRVMTIHQSKGLGFDLVILPNLMGHSLTTARPVSFIAARDRENDTATWALRMPRKAICDADPVLRDQLDAVLHESCFEELCVLYVAMTRARRGLYMVTAYPGKASESLTPAAFIKRQLCGSPNPVDGEAVTLSGNEFTCLFKSGIPDWYAGLSSPEEPAQPPLCELPGDFATRSSSTRRIARVRPSGQEHRATGAGELFSTDYRDRLTFGSAVHAIFERVAWLDDTDTLQAAKDWSAASDLPDPMKTSVTGHFARAMESTAVRAALSRPPGPTKLWIEKSFETVVRKRLVSGVLDRVIIHLDDKEKAVRAEILDYKTDDVRNDAEMEQAVAIYRPQLLLYRDAVCRLLSLPRKQVSATLLFTSHPRLIPVLPEQ